LLQKVHQRNIFSSWS